MAERRHIRLVTDPAVLVAAEDRRWLASSRYGPEVPLPRQATDGPGRTVMRSMANFGDTIPMLD